MHIKFDKAGKAKTVAVAEASKEKAPKQTTPKAVVATDKKRKREENEKLPAQAPPAKKAKKSLDPLILQVQETHDVVEYNQLISLFGKQKRLGQAFDTFDTLVESGLYPTIYTYSSMINACVRCSEMERAQSFHDQMVQAGLQPNEITFTTLIKGYSQDGLMTEATAVYKDMKQYKVRPNIRTFNTILRGCLRSGDMTTAKFMFTEMKSNRVHPDATAYGYMIKALCQELQTEEAWKLAEEMENGKCTYSPAYSALATSCALIGDISGAQKALLAVNRAVKQESKEYQWQQQNPHASVPLFLKLRNEEVDRECKRAREYLNKLHSLKQKAPRFGNYPNSQRVHFLPKDDKTLDFEQVCKNTKPVRIEVCSGHGEWVVDKAKHDADSNWVALEMRYERVFQIWSKMIFDQVDNLNILGGEAHAIFKACITDNSVDEVFVNYPDPPIWEESKMRLLDEAFLRDVHRALKPKCSLTIVTDNDYYGKQILQELTALKDIYKSAHGNKWYLDQVPNNYGTSYFDRLWKNGSKEKRFYFKLEKI